MAWRRSLDAGHVRRMVDVLDDLPPITVTSDYRLVDGQHRLRAHELGGRASIRAVVLDEALDETELMARAIEANVRHGRPLSSSERTRLAVDLLASGWDGSDAELARRCGVSRGRVPTLRRLALDKCRQASPNTGAGAPTGLQPVLQDRLEADQRRRTSRDGKSVPGDPAAQRARIAAPVTQRPTATNAAIASEVGCSATTVAKVRATLADHHRPGGVRRWLRRVLGLLAWRHRQGRISTVTTSRGRSPK
jgi:hypothetical protein